MPWRGMAEEGQVEEGGWAYRGRQPERTVLYAAENPAPGSARSRTRCASQPTGRRAMVQAAHARATAGEVLSGPPALGLLRRADQTQGLPAISLFTYQPQSSIVSGVSGRA